MINTSFLVCRLIGTATRFSVLLLFSLSITFCNKPDISDKGERLNPDPATSQADSLIKAIHRQLYENPAEARALAFMTLDTLPAENQEVRLKLLKYIGSSYVLETNYSEGLNYYSQALQVAEATGLFFEIANINNNLGMVYNEIGSYKMAYIHLVEALNNYDLAGNQDARVAALNNIGLTFLYLKNYEKALSYFDEALDPHIQSKDSILIVSVMNNMALCYLSGDRSDSALSFLQQAAEISKRINNKYGLCISYQLMGDVYMNLEKTDKAYEAYSESEAIAKENNLTYQLAVARLGITKVLLRTGNTGRAFNIAFEVMDMAVNQNSLILKSDAHQVLSDIYEKERDYENGLKHYREHIRAQQEIINQTVIHQVYDVELNYLNQLNAMQQLELEKKELAISKKNNLLFFISMTFIMIFIGFYLVYLNHRHRQKVKLQETVIELTEKKSNAALEAEIQERKRIGQELHDSLGHLLSLAGLQASVLYKRKDITEVKRKELLEALMKSIDDAFHEVRTISHNLAPSLLSERGLKGALKNISDRVNQTTGLTMSFDTFGLNGTMDNLVENTLFRTIQEIVNNTIKHAGATNLYIQITRGTHEITLMAEDNGKGFNMNEINIHTGYGLSNMKSRIENLNGTMFIDSNPNRGTIISIFIPL